jgi:tRNA A-37 threonylcarbamoyl transferase component Bud32
VRSPPPSGYRRFLIRGAEVVSRADVLDAVRSALASGSLYDYASHHPKARELSGRDTAYAVPLPGADVRVVVRHNRHGGLFAPVTGDVFLAPRAPYELDVSLKLQQLGVSTPDVLAYAIYQAGAILRRSDVVTREVPNSRDLSDVLLSKNETLRATGLSAAARLVGQLALVGARHHDLNVKNVLLANDGEDGLRALILDVDRVTFHAPGDVTILERNLERFVRSARKWRDRRDANISDGELDRFTLEARATVTNQLVGSTRS